MNCRENGRVGLLVGVGCVCGACDGSRSAVLSFVFPARTEDTPIADPTDRGVPQTSEHPGETETAGAVSATTAGPHRNKKYNKQRQIDLHRTTIRIKANRSPRRRTKCMNVLEPTGALCIALCHMNTEALARLK